MMSYCRQVLLSRVTTVILLAIGSSHFTSADVLTCSSSTITISFDYEPKVFKYPESGQYPISVTCRWLFKAKASDFTFFLKFTDINIGSETFNIYDGEDASETKLYGSGGITSSTDNNYRYSATDKLFMEFTSDTTSDPSETGFTLEIGNGKDTSGCPTPSTSQTITLSSSPYFLTSPNFPSSYYPLNTNCKWTFTTSDQSATIVVRFLYNNFDKYQGKCFDNVKVYEGTTVMQAALIGSELCDNTFLSTETRNSTGDSITVDFYSDDRVIGKGFSALVYEIEGSQSATPEQTTKSDATTTTTAETITTKSSTTTETATISSQSDATTSGANTMSQSDTTTTEAGTTSQSDTTTTEAGTTSQSDTTTTEADTTSQSDTTSTEADTMSQSDTTSTEADTTSQSDTTSTEADTTSQSDTTTKASTTSSAVEKTTKNEKGNDFPMSDEAVLVLVASSLAFVFLIIIIIGIACCANMSRKRKRRKPAREGKQRLYVSYFGNLHFSPT